MKLESDFYSLPRDGQSAEEHVCDEGGSRRALGLLWAPRRASTALSEARMAKARGDKIGT